MKKNNFIIIILSLLFAGSISAQTEQLVKQQPEKPKAGDNVIITYNASIDKATLKNAKEMTLYVMIFGSEKGQRVIEQQMTNNNNNWTASFKLDDASENLLVYFFDDGTNKEYNDGEAWLSMIYNAKNLPVKGAYSSQASLYSNSGFMDFKINKSKEKSLEFLNREIAANPGYVPAYNSKWNTMMRDKPGDETIAIIKKELDKVYSLNKTDEKMVFRLLNWFEKTNQKAKADEIRTSILKKNPKGYMAQMSRIDAIYDENDPSKQIEMCKQILTDFPDLDQQNKDYMNSAIFSAFVEKKDYETAANLLGTFITKNSGQYNNLAWPLIEKGEQLEKAVKWANEGMKLAENPDISEKPSYWLTKTWKMQNEQSLGMISDTYAFGLYQLGYTIAAEKSYEKAYSVLKGSDEDVNARFVECLVNNGNYSKAVEVSEECMIKEKSNSNLIKQYKTAWLKLNRNESEFDSKITNLSNKAKEETFAKLKKEMVNKPAIDFSLKSLDGSTVKLSDLKGKIVVIDFWATWCGPCKASFPALQKITDKYKSNPNIVILTLDTWEQVKGDERTAKVKEFIESNKYTFTVLFDEDFVSKYEVSGIPTKFIVDRYGKIQFKTIGFGGEAKMLTEMEAQFEILSNDDYLKELN
jgi:thiol-disulfide isomerase/thioredoxin/tetratricopeptide (TPR) repeat protein